MNENRIQQVLKIEQEAQQVAEAAKRDAEQLPLAAEQEAQAILEKARAEALEEAKQIVANAEAKEQSEKIQAEAQEKIQKTKELSAGNLDKAVAYVLNRVTGKE